MQYKDMTYSDNNPLPPLRDVIKNFGLSAKKTLGQNFLLDMNITQKIAREAGAGTNDRFLEIGPGPGGLTRALLIEGASHVTVIEKDTRCLDALHQISEAFPNRLTIIEGDALKTDFNSLMDHKPYRIAANLPYNISSEILIKWLCEAQWPPLWKSATLMFQKEFVERLRSSHGNKNYGRLSVLCGWRAYATKAFDVHPSNFTPPPKVTSSIVKIEPNPSPAECDIDKLQKLTAATFGQRRKMIRSSLKFFSQNPEELCQKASISSELRADNVTVAEYIRLANIK